MRDSGPKEEGQEERKREIREKLKRIGKGRGAQMAMWCVVSG